MKEGTFRADQIIVLNTTRTVKYRGAIRKSEYHINRCRYPTNHTELIGIYK